MIKLWPGDWDKWMAKMNEVVGMKNYVTVDRGGRRLVRPFRRQELWKCIDCILSSVTYGKKGHNLWSKLLNHSVKMAPAELQRYVSGNTNL